MDNTKETWENTQTKNHKPSKTYGLSSMTTVSHLATHDVRCNDHGLHEPPEIFLTVATYDCEFALLQNQFATGKMTSDPQFKELLKAKTNYPIMQCQLQYHINNAQYKDCLIGYLIDMYSNIYTLNFTRNIELSTKFAIHPVQYTTIYRNNIYNPNIDELYLQTPLLLKKLSDGIISVNLKGEIQFIDINQSKSWISSYDDHLNAHRLDLGHSVLAAAHNTFKCKYDNVIVVAAHNMKVPYVFVNCSSLSDFENQKAFQDKYQWMEDSVQITYCSIDPKTSIVAVSTVTQNLELFQITSINSNYYLKKKFGFFMGANLHQTDFNIDLNIQNLHANRGMLMIVSCKEYLIFDIQNRMIRKRGKGTAISMMRYGGIIDRNDNFVSILIVKGYNHVNQAQSKTGKPNLHFKTIDVNKKDKM